VTRQKGAAHGQRIVQAWGARVGGIVAEAAIGQGPISITQRDTASARGNITECSVQKRTNPKIFGLHLHDLLEVDMPPVAV